MHLHTPLHACTSLVADPISQAAHQTRRQQLCDPGLDVAVAQIVAWRDDAALVQPAQQDGQKRSQDSSGQLSEVLNDDTLSPLAAPPIEHTCNGMCADAAADVAAAAGSAAAKRWE